MALTLSQPHADIFIPDGRSLDSVLRQGVTHLGIGAHQDDLEFNAFHGILSCYHVPGKAFAGVICTDGAGSSRTGPYGHVSDQEMRAVRQREQRAAAVTGEYALLAQLDYSSQQLKSADNARLARDLAALISELRPGVVYTHNPADKHETHLAVFSATLKAIRSLPEEQRPGKLLGYEGWRSLDWVIDSEKTILDVSQREHLFSALAGIFDSQIAGGKRYDLATVGRLCANATFGNSHAADAVSRASLALDLTPLITDDSLDPVEFTLGFVDRLREDIRTKLGNALSL
ncbi:MAG: hypothetical protein BGO12_14305 [Verrucomicrobia bacterium 61-8]|nr:MAG: hypothetical protein BGO12_14305 [Verrucomicrobia bacterium 61-8]